MSNRFEVTRIVIRDVLLVDDTCRDTSRRAPFEAQICPLGINPQNARSCVQFDLTDTIKHIEDRTETRARSELTWAGIPLMKIVLKYLNPARFWKLNGSLGLEEPFVSRTEVE